MAALALKMLLICDLVLYHVTIAFQLRTLMCPSQCECYKDQIFCDNSGYDAIPQRISPMTRRLDLSNNNITVIRSDLSKLKALETLDVSGNRLSIVSNRAFENNHRMKDLHLERNNLTLISFTPLHWRSLDGLLSLNVAHNHLGPNLTAGMFEGLTGLQLLDLEKNNIRHIPEGCFWGLQSLSHLVLKDNSLTQIPKQALTSLTQLQLLDLSANPITNIGDYSFPQLPALDILMLNKMNVLTTVGPKAFSGLTKLRVLELSKCPLLQELPPNLFKGLHDLNLIYLNDNGLRHLGQDLVAWEDIKADGIHLYGNPWECNCHLQWMSIRSGLLSHVLANPDHVTCRSPHYFLGEPILRLNPRDFICYKHTHAHHKRYPEETDYKDESFPRLFAIIVPTFVSLSMFILVLTVYCRRMRKSRDTWLLRSLSYGSLQRDNMAYAGSESNLNSNNTQGLME